MGIFFRFVNLDRKIYWFDETYTLLRVSGYTEAEMLQQVFNGNLIKVEDIKKFRQINPEKQLINTINSLALEDVQHPPLYYILARFGMQLFGNSMATTRGVSALISLFALPCVYWLCLELFELPFIGWLAIALICVSPFHLAFAQEAREYSLWTVTIILSSASLLQAMRLKNRLNWSIYAVTMALSYYALPLSFLVAVGHGIYVFVIENFSWNKTLKSYILVSIGGILAFAPWLWVIVSRIPSFAHTTDWVKQPIALTKLLALWMRNLSYVFCDLQYQYEKLEGFTAILLILVAYAIYYICRYSQKRIWLFVMLLIGLTSLSMILPDLILGGQRSTINRYLIPSYLGIQLAVAYLFGTKITSISIPVKFQNLWRIIIIVLITLGILSCAASSRAHIWWNKSKNWYTLSVAELINQATRPIIISDGDAGDVLALSYLLEPKVQLKVQSSCYTSCSNNFPQAAATKLTNIPNGFTDVFLYKPSEFLQSRLSDEYNIEYIPHTSNTVWQLKKR
ncbi:MAG: glycosyltransferase family 39 protein [Stigonema ocellatum SAG 48.90 = DSM 106950]|nr:glycosyltransferase family 39 protein [Stigonema ocellatum SAG 48.90 = DSM 106950]